MAKIELHEQRCQTEIKNNFEKKNSSKFGG